MIDVADAPTDGSLHLVEGGVRMAGVAANAFGTAGADEFFRARQFRSDRRGNDGVGVGEILFEFLANRWTDGRGGVAAAGVETEVGAVEVSAEDACAAGAFVLEKAAGFKEGEMLIVASDGRRRQEACRSVAGRGGAD